MQNTPKLSARARRRLLAVVVLALLGVIALAVGLPTMLTGPAGGSLAGY